MVENILISDTATPNFVVPNHPVLVRDAFLASYPDFAGQFYFRTDFNQNTYDFAKANNCQIVIRSISGVFFATQLAQNNYYDGILTFMPTGSNDQYEVFESNGGLNLPAIIVTGAGDINNETADDIEFFSPDPITIEPDYSSFSNGYIAGQIAKLVNTLNCGMWEARYRARQTASEGTVWSETNGYGVIDIEAAINFIGEIPVDPYNPDPANPPEPVDIILGTVGNILAKKNGNHITISWDAVNSANSYTVIKKTQNGAQVILDGNVLSIVDIINDYPGKIEYKYKARKTNPDLSHSQTEFSITVIYKSKGLELKIG